jgi:hypothetical protein
MAAGDENCIRIGRASTSFEIFCNRGLVGLDLLHAFFDAVVKQIAQRCDAGARVAEDGAS